MPRKRVPTGRSRGRPYGIRRSVPLERITERRRRGQRRPKSIKEENIAKPADVETSEYKSNILEPAMELSTEDTDSEADYIIPEFTESTQDGVNYEHEPLIKLEPVESEVTNVPESTESIQDGVNYGHEPLVKLEPVESEEDRGTSLEDFIYSNFNSLERAIEESDYKTLQVFYQLLYQRSARDTKEILKQKILEFSGFSFDNDSQEYFNREMMLERLPNKVLVKIGNLLGCEQVKKMAGEKIRAKLIVDIMQFLRVMKHSTTQKVKSNADVTLSPATIYAYKTPVRLKTSCICRYRCLAKTTEVQRRALLEYLEDLKKLKLFESYIFNFIEIIRKKNIGNKKQKVRACAYLYKVKLGYQEFLVCKDGFIDYHGLSQKRLLRFQNKLKSGIDLPPKLEMSQFPVFIPPQTNQEDNIEDFSESDESISYEINENKTNCIDLLSSGEDSDYEKLVKTKYPKKATSTTVKPIPSNIVRLPAPNPVTSNTPSTNGQQSSATSSPSNTQTGGIRRLRDFKTICKIINRHPPEYLIDIFDLLYLKKHEPATLRKDILDFSGFTFGKRSTDYISRKLLLERMQYNSINRIYNTLFPTTEVKVISKLTMISEIFQLLFKLADQDTGVCPLQALKPETKTTVVSDTKKTIGTVLAPDAAVGTTTGKLSNLEGVFHKVACFPCEHLTEVHKLLFMTDCDPKVIRQNIYAFKGFEFGPKSQEFQQRKKYLEDLTFFTLRKISNVLSAQPVDLRNLKNSATKRKMLAVHLTQVLVEYCNPCADAEILQLQIDKPTALSTTVTSTADNTGLENIVCTQTKDQSLLNTEILQVEIDKPTASSTTVTSSADNTGLENIVCTQTKDQSLLNSHIESTTKPCNPKEPPKSQTNTLTIPIVYSTPISSPVVTTTLGSDIRKPNVKLYHHTVTGITTISASGISQTFRMNQPISFPIVHVQPNPITGLPIKNPVQTKPTEVFSPGETIANEEHPCKKLKTSSEKSVPEKNSFHNKFNAFDEEEDCDKPLSSLIGNQSLLYKLLKQNNSNFNTEFKTNSRDCSVTIDKR